MSIRLECGHEAIDREKTRAYHGATELWCPVCGMWMEFVIADQGVLFDQDRPRRNDGTLHTGSSESEK